MTKKKSSGPRRSKNIAVLPLAAKMNAIFQVIEPYVQRTPALIAAAQARDLPAFIATLREGNKECLSMANVLQALGPMAGLAVLRYISRHVRIPNPRLGPVRAF